MPNNLPLMIREILSQTGWDTKEIEVYSVLLSKGGMNLTDIAQETQMPVSSVQYTLKKLASKKVITKIVLNDHPLYTVTDLELLRHIVKHHISKYEQYDQIMLNFIEQYDFSPDVYRPKGIRFYEGIKGVKLSYMNTLEENQEKEIKAVFSVENYHEGYLMDFFRETFIPARVKRGIKFKALALESREAEVYQAGDSKELRETRVVPKGDLPAVDAEVSLYDDCMHFVSVNERGMFAMILQDKNLIALLKAIFQIMWKKYK